MKRPRSNSVDSTRTQSQPSTTANYANDSSMMRVDHSSDSDSGTPTSKPAPPPPPRLVRLLMVEWPFPLKSYSTYSILLGLMVLILVIMDEFVWHLWTNTNGANEEENRSIESLDSLVSEPPRFILHLLRHSFTYRCLFCGLWILGMFIHGYWFVHDGYRRRGGTSKKTRRGSNTANVNATTSESSPKSVTFASSELPATDLVPPTRLATKKRLRLFFFLALILALCGIAFEFYLMFANKPGSSSRKSSVTDTVTSTLNSTFFSFYQSFSWIAFLSMTARILLIGLWFLFCCYAAYHLWYRKAIGIRKSKKGTHRPTTGTMVEGDESSEDEYDEEGDEVNDASEIKTVGENLVHVPPVALVSSPATTSDSSLNDSPDVDEDEDDLSDSESDSDTTSFPVPTSAELLMFEKLDANLFYHPEQAQNQYQGYTVQTVEPTAPTAIGLVKSVSATTSPVNTKHKGAAHGHKPHHHQPHVGRGKIAESPTLSPSSSMSGLPPMPPVSLPLSASSPILHATLYHLASTKFLSNLSPEDFNNFLPELQWKHVEAGDIIYHLGSVDGERTVGGQSLSSVVDLHSTDGMYIIVSGTVGALDPNSPTAQVLNTFHQGDSIGEIEFLFGHLPRAFTAVALTPVQMLRIPAKLSHLWNAPATNRQLPSEEIAASAAAMDPSAYAAAHALNSFSSEPHSIHDSTPAPRSDILLSFIRTTLARQWRSAEFILQQFLNLPVPTDSNLHMDPTVNSLPIHSRYWSPAFAQFFSTSSTFFHTLQSRTSNQIELSQQSILFEEGSYRSDQLFIVLEGTMWMSSTRHSTENDISLRPGSVCNPIAYFTDTNYTYSIRASSPIVKCAWLNRDDLSHPHADVLRLAFTVCDVLGPTLAQFQSLGLQRNWIRAGTLVFKESQPADSLYVIASGRIRIVTGKLKKVVKRKRTPSLNNIQTIPQQSQPPNRPHPSGYDFSVFTERDVYLPYQRTAATSSAQRPKPNVSAVKRVRFELSRGELVGEVSFLNSVEHPNELALHGASALCTKDCELIKISRGCFEHLLQTHPRVLLKFSQILATRLRDIMSLSQISGSKTEPKRSSVLSTIPRSPFLTHSTSSPSTTTCVSVCIVSASTQVDLQQFALNLSLSLSAQGRTMLLTPKHVDRILGEQFCSHLNSYYHRSAFTYWLSSVEAEYQFLIFVTDPSVNSWTMQCQRQADLTLIVANADDHLDDDFDEDEEEDEVAQRHNKQRMRSKRVSQFEKLVCWNGAERVLMKQQQKQQRKRQSSSDASSIPATSSDPSKTILGPNFSPTIHPSLIPTSTAATTANVTLNSSTCYPRLHFSLHDLVLLHQPNSTPRGTRFWTASRPNLHRYHHLALGAQEHFDRLARYIAGKTVGVVLSGGGARGLSHLGVLTSFAEQSVPIDFIGGTSQGSFMAALYASQPYHHVLALQQMKARVYTMAERMGSIWGLLSDATFPVLSYFAGKRFGANIAAILGESIRIEDLWIPYYCVTTNLSQADMCVHDRGVLWKAVRASMTVLEYLPPMQISKRWPDMLIDGGYINNLPVDVCHGLFQPCYVIGVDVENKSSEEKIAKTSYYGPHLSGFWLFKTRMMDWIKAGWMGLTMKQIRKLYKAPQDTNNSLNLPKFAELVGSLIYIGHNRNIRQSFDSKLIDLYIRPDLGTIALLDYGLCDSIVEIGYQCTKVKLTEWRIRNSSHLPKATPTQEERLTPHAVTNLASSTTLPSPPNLQRTNSNSSLVPPPATFTSTSTAGAPSLNRRKTSIAAHTPKHHFLAPSTLTFTHDLTTAPTTETIQRTGASGSPLLHSASAINLSQWPINLSDSHTSATSSSTVTMTGLPSSTSNPSASILSTISSPQLSIAGGLNGTNSFSCIDGSCDSDDINLAVNRPKFIGHTNSDGAPIRRHASESDMASVAGN